MAALDILKKKIESKGFKVDEVLPTYGVLINTCICETIDEILDKRLERIQDSIQYLRNRVNNTDRIIND